MKDRLRAAKAEIITHEQGLNFFVVVFALGLVALLLAPVAEMTQYAWLLIVGGVFLLALRPQL